MLTIRPVPVVAQVGQRRADQPEGSLHVHRPHRVEIRFVSLLEVDRAQDPGVVHEGVDPAHALHRRGDPRIDRAGQVRVEVDRHQTARRTARGPAEPGRLTQVPEPQGDRPAIAEKPLGDGRPETPPSAGDHGDSCHRRCPSPSLPRFGVARPPRQAAFDRRASNRSRPSSSPRSASPSSGRRGGRGRPPPARPSRSIAALVAG